MKVVQTSFSAGELSPQAYGRSDLAKYQSGLQKCQGFIPLVHGPLTKRGGWEHRIRVKDHSKKVRLFGFDHSATNSYILEFGDLYVRFHKPSGQIVANGPTNITAATKANPVVITAGAHGYSDGDIVFIQNVLGMTELNGNEYTVANKATNTFELSGVDGTAYTAYTSGGTTQEPYSISTPYTEAQLDDLDFETSGDTLWIAHGSHKPAQLLRTSDASWAFSYLTFTNGPLNKENATDTQLKSTLVLSGSAKAINGISLTNPCVINTTTAHGLVKGNSVYLYDIVGTDELNITTHYIVGDVAANSFELEGIDARGYTAWTSGGFAEATTYPLGIIIATSTTGINGGSGFTASDVGRLISIYHTEGTESEIGVAEITSISSTVNVGVTVTKDFLKYWDSGSTAWRLGAWRAADGWPEQVELNNERLCFAKTATWPLRIWLSATGLYYTHEINAVPADDDAIDVELGGRQANEIEWLLSGGKFAVGTNGAEYWLADSSGGGAITNTSRQAVVGSRDGAGTTKPIMAGSTLLFMMKHNKALKELRYSLESDSYAGEILTALAEHLTRDNTITEMAFQSEPYRVLWCRRDDGTLLGLTYYPEHDVFGWHVHPAVGTDADIERITVVPGTTYDELFAVIKRTINGSTVRYIERLADVFTGADTDDATFLDSYLTLDNRQTVTSISYADPGVITLAAHGYTDGDTVTFRTSDRLFDYTTSLHYEDYTVAHKATNTFQLHDSEGNDVDLTSFNPASRTPAQTLTITVAKKVTLITGLDHLEGETVGCLADGADDGEYTVSNGSITLGSSASLVCVGKTYEADAQLFTPGYSDQQRAIPAAKKTIKGVIFQLYKTLGLKFGQRFASGLYDIPFGDSNDTNLGRSAPLQDGLTDEYEMECDTERGVNLCIRSDQPLPCTILAVYQEVESEKD